MQRVFYFKLNILLASIGLEAKRAPSKCEDKAHVAGPRDRAEAEKIVMEWLVNGNIPERINSAKSSFPCHIAKPAKAESAFTGSLPSKESALAKSQRMI